MGNPGREPRQVSLAPLDDDDVTEMLAAFADASQDGLTIGSAPVEDYRIGDPTAIAAIIVASTPAVGALAAFLLKRRQRSSVEYSLTVNYADGTSVRETIKLHASDSQPPNAEVVGKLADLTRVDPADISDILG